jgi:hypothetical protein
MEPNGTESSMRHRNHSAECCYRQPTERVTVRSYPPLVHVNPADPPKRFGLIRCTPERPDGCCSFEESAFDSRSQADEAADRLNRVAHGAGL